MRTGVHAMKRGRFLFLCLLLFALGCVGRWAFRAPKAAAVPFLLTVTADAADAFLKSALPDVGDEIRVGDTAGRVVAVDVRPRRLLYRKNGESLLVSSSLFLSVSLTVSLHAASQNGLPVLGGTPSFLGDTLTVATDTFVFIGDLTALSRLNEA